MTKEQALVELQELQMDMGDVEACHSNADDILCKLLISLGHQDVVNEWEKIEKWYA